MGSMVKLDGSLGIKTASVSRQHSINDGSIIAGMLVVVASDKVVFMKIKSLQGQCWQWCYIIS